MNRISLISLYILITCACVAVSCKKSNVNDSILKFSTPIVSFDTVFTSIGSVTRYFTVHNTSNSEITTTIFLAGGKQSQYSINVDGLHGTYFKDVVIPKKDSIFIFVKVNIDPDKPISNSPFFVKDSIVFLTGQRTQDVKLLAFGQNARYIVADQGSASFRFKVVAGLPQDGYKEQDVTWTNERPYVVYGWAVVDSACSLTIEPGTKIYFHNNSGLLAYRYSKLTVGLPAEQGGSLENLVLFRGDRLESWYNDDYAQWNRIWANEGAEVSINHAIITNAFIGIQVDPFPDETSITVTPNSLVKIENTIIKNTKHCGVLGRFLNIEMTNCVITNNGECSMLLEGGNYTMKHVTVGNYFMQAERKVPACYVSNSISAFANPVFYETNADFINCIFYGNRETEVIVNKAQNAELKVLFQNCLIKSKDNSGYFIDCLRNTDPYFKDIGKLDFSLQPTSPAIGKGKDIGVYRDILGNVRGDKPDIGAYQE